MNKDQERHKLVLMTQKELENINRHINTKCIESVIKINFQHIKTRL